MKMFGMMRRNPNDSTQKQICVGSSPISGKPYWAVAGKEPTCQPLLFRDESYAQWCLDIAEREDVKAGETGYDYDTFQVELIGFHAE